MKASNGARLLPLLTSGPHGSRSHMTCHYRCGNACDKPVPNTSDNPEFSTLVEKTIARRSVLKAGGVGAGALVVGGLTGSTPAAAGTGPVAGRAGSGSGVGSLAFTPVAPNVRDNVTVPRGFTYDVVVRWGDPVTSDAPAFDAYHQSPESAAKQFGYNNDYVGVLPITSGKAVLVANNEYTDEELMFPAGVYDDATVKKIAMASHGMSVVEIERGRKAGSWRRSNHRGARLNRRFTASTPFVVDGPAAGSERLRTSADPSGRRVLGTFANCSGGTTPWGTVLSGEENFNGYFDKSGALDSRYSESYARYGLTGSGRGWKDVDQRFDLTAEPHEPFRFGWVVEVDPLDPKSTPRKHSMLGRFKHEGANVTIARDGRAVVYMGDDERGDYIYKFVSADTFDPGDTQQARKHNLTLLTKGTLYVARFTDEASDPAPEYDGVGQWIPLTSDTRSFVQGMSVVDVLVDTRLAADKVGPTKMDRPEDIEPNPVNGKIYCALTNNSNRGSKYPADEANPLSSSMVRSQIGAPLTSASGNRNGYVLEVTEDGGDHTSTAFTWDLMLVCGDPEAQETYFAGYPKEKVSPISCPDNVAFDKVGNLWISTDGNQLGSNDGLFRVPVAGPERGKVEQFLTVPVGAETCGPLISEDQQSVFAAVQHPGETDGASFENPSSTWPHTDQFPRPSVVVAYQA
ncbi:MAG TPA: PhoX family phosphatase [Nocardioidaceae bacterium]|nr:PhoX family phosphatase [Nocardioidaceae bacterium]